MISPSFILSLILIYFIVLIFISYFTGKENSNQIFFTANNDSAWPLVAFGMVGASLSGVTFISVPGWIESSQFSYFQVVLGYFVGYLIVSFVLLPIYYQYNVTSIYEYLENRFGYHSHKAGAFFFFVSRVIGASFRLFLVAIVMQQFIFDSWNVPFELTVILSIALIWVYTNRGGIKTIVWTDTIQTTLMIISVVLSIIYINKDLGWSLFDFLNSTEFEKYNNIFVTDSFLKRNYFLKSFLGGAFITICMTGLDQDMMQKNLSCRSLKDAQKNMLVFSIVLVIVTFLFMVLGALLYTYSIKQGISLPIMDGKPNTDLLFPEIALNGGLGITVAITFILGLIAAAYSSADSALTSLTTSVCIDFLEINKKNKSRQVYLRKKTHILLSFLLIIVVILFKYILDRNVIDGLLTVAGYTYGPLLGIFSFGIFTNYKINDKYVWFILFTSVLITSVIGNINSDLIWGYEIGYELLPINGLITFIGLILIRRK
jgi:Na+/proline symporter